jgi:hypothetical protein
MGNHIMQLLNENLLPLFIGGAIDYYQFPTKTSFLIQ